MFDYGRIKATFNHGQLENYSAFNELTGSARKAKITKNTQEKERFWPNGNIREKFKINIKTGSGKQRVYDTKGTFVGVYTYIHNNLVGAKILKEGKWVEKPREEMQVASIDDATNFMRHLRKIQERS